MRILVPVKRVLDPYAKVKALGDGSGIDTSGVKSEINPFDEIALEEAVRIRENGAEVEIVAVSIGSTECEEQLRKALAIGADRAILVETTAEYDSPAVAKELAEVVRDVQPQMILMGKQATDDDNNQAAQMLAAILDIPQATFACKVQVGDSQVTVTRETDNGTETLQMPYPCVVTTDLRLNEPRYVALPGIIKARSKPLDKISPRLEVKLKTRTTRYETPAARSAGKKVASVDELISELKSKGVLA